VLITVDRDTIILHIQYRAQRTYLQTVTCFPISL